MATAIKKLRDHLAAPVSSAPLAIFRIVFGLLMLVSVSRFMAKGWVYSMYIAPKVYFPFFGLDWLQPLPGNWMYVVFAVMLLCAAGILTGFFYRMSAVLFFVLFTYVELIDRTNYLNHYYFISLVSALLVILPAGRVFSLDNLLFRRGELTHVPRGAVLSLKLQMFAVYFFAGIAKINADWLLEAMPLRIWLPAHSHLPLLGPFLATTWVAYVFSWFGCAYDLLIAFMLFSRRTVKPAYFLVVVFHLFTALFFNIGMFPFIMMAITTIFFPVTFHEAVLGRLKQALRYPQHGISILLPRRRTLIVVCFIAYFSLQAALPFRYLLFPGDLYWTEQGYRFSWRVMLMEKAGIAMFHVTDATGRMTEVDNREHLTYMQEKMMATQPDMLVDYAKYLKSCYAARGYRQPVVSVDSYVTLNGSGSRRFARPDIDIASLDASEFSERSWLGEPR